jgi:hypothetical protein
VGIKQLTQNSAADAFGSGSFPSKTFKVNKNRNSPASGGCSSISVSGLFAVTRQTKSMAF